MTNYGPHQLQRLVSGEASDTRNGAIRNLHVALDAQAIDWIKAEHMTIEETVPYGLHGGSPQRPFRASILVTWEVPADVKVIDLGEAPF